MSELYFNLLNFNKSVSVCYLATRLRLANMSEPESPIKLGTQSQHSSVQRLEELQVPEILISAHISDEGTHKGGSIKGGRAASVR